MYIADTFPGWDATVVHPRFIVKGATSWLVHLEKFSLIFSSSSFAICVNLLHP